MVFVKNLCKMMNDNLWIKLKKSSVSDMPQVEISTTSASEVKQGNKMTLTCNVKRSQPQPHTYSWRKNGEFLSSSSGQTYVVERIKPEDSGSYTCEAINIVGTGTSKPLQITVVCKFDSSLCCINVRELMMTDHRKHTQCCLLFFYEENKHFHQ